RNLGAGSRLDLAAVFLALRDHCAVYQELTVVGGLDHGTGDTYVWIPAVEHTSREAALVTGFKGHTNLAVGGALAQPKRDRVGGFDFDGWRVRGKRRAIVECYFVVHGSVGHEFVLFYCAAFL